MAPSHYKAAIRSPQGINTPPNPPRTPSTTPRDTFDLTPQTQTTTSFADSGFFSSPSTDHKYQDWVLFPEDGEIGKGEFLDTTGFFKDADQCVTRDLDCEDDEESYPYEENASASVESSLTLSSYASNADSHNTTAKNDALFRTVHAALQSYTISSPPTSPRPQYLKLELEEKEEVSMLDIWQKKVERHESIAYRFEQAPYTARDHLLPVWRQESRVRRRSGKKNGRGRRSVRS